MTDKASEIAKVGETARPVLESKHQSREAALPACRKAIQSSAVAIREVHRGEFEAAERHIAEGQAALATAIEAMVGNPDVQFAGFFHDAAKEVVEANLTLAFVRGDPLPTAEQLGVSVQSYLHGMAEAASELRRQILDCLRREDSAEAEKLFAVMDEVLSMLATIDFPEAITQGLRRNTDGLRAVTERTRGDITTALVATRLQQAVNERASK